MNRLLWLLPAAALIAGVWWIQQARRTPPAVEFARPRKERLVSEVATNGRVEPIEFSAVRARIAGAVVRLPVERGQKVPAGGVLVELDTSRARAELAAAEARIAQMQAERKLLLEGGRPREIAEIDASLARLELDRADALRQVESLERLVSRKAAPAIELTAARQRLAQIDAEKDGLNRRRSSLVAPADREAAEARLREAEAAAALARQQIEQAAIRAPLAGVLYQLDSRPGSYLQPGDLVGYVGRIDEVRVLVYVDEPELGAIRLQQPVLITWDALPGRQWLGKVEKLPTQIAAYGPRQVGEVLCRVDNPEQLLLPQTNVNAQIRTRVVENALTIGKESLRREDGQTGIFVLNPDRTVRWQPVQIGASSVTRLEITNGLDPEAAVALPTDQPLQNGMRVTPVFRSTR